MENFKSEKARQDYYKKLHLKNNEIAQKVDDKLTEAYHEVEFGVIPQIEDNRSLAEKLADERLNQDQAQKNALMLMANDGSATSRLLNLIGTARYGEFNRYFLDIYNSLKGQIGKVAAQDVYNYIDRYLTKANVTNGVDIPNVEMLVELINAIQNIPQGQVPVQAPPVTVNIDLNDVILRLQALETVLTNTGNDINQIEYNTRNLPSTEDIQRILDSLGEMDNTMTTNQRDNMRATLDSANFIRDEVRNVGERVRNTDVGNSLRFNEIMEQLRMMVDTIDEDSLESVISDITDVSYREEEYEDDEDDEDDEIYGDAPEYKDGEEEIVEVIDNIIAKIEDIAGEELDDEDEQSLADSIYSSSSFKSSSELAKDFFNKSKLLKRRPELLEELVKILDEEGSIQSTDSLKSHFERLKTKSENIQGKDEKIEPYIDAYNYVNDYINGKHDDFNGTKDRLRYMFEINKLPTNQFKGLKTKETMLKLFTNNKTKLERTYKYSDKKNRDNEVNMQSKTELKALERISDHIDSLEPEIQLEFVNEYIMAYDNLKLKLQDAITNKTTGNNLKPKITDVNRADAEELNKDFNNFSFIISSTENKDGSKLTATKYSGLDVLNRVPYTTVYNGLLRFKNALEQPQQAIESNKIAFEESKTGNGLKRLNKMFKRRVY